MAGIVGLMRSNDVVGDDTGTSVATVETSVGGSVGTKVEVIVGTEVRVGVALARCSAVGIGVKDCKRASIPFVGVIAAVGAAGLTAHAARMNSTLIR